MADEKKAKPGRSVISGQDVNNSRHWDDAALNQAMQKDLNKRILKMENPHILEIGCGAGVGLKALASTAPYLKNIYGIDIHPLESKAKGYHFIRMNVEDMPVAQGGKFHQKFDIILAQAVFPYVENKKEALLKIAQALTPGGHAYIRIEPFYFGPEGYGILAGCNKFRWFDNTGIVIEGGITAKEIKKFMAHYKKCPIPENMRTLNNGIVAINWNLMEFLKVEEYNPDERWLGMCCRKSPLSTAGDKDHRPFTFTCPVMYLGSKHAMIDIGDEVQVSSLLTDPKSWDQMLLKPDWKPNPEYRASIAKMKSPYLPSSNFCSWFSLYSSSAKEEQREQPLSPISSLSNNPKEIKEVRKRALPPDPETAGLLERRHI